MHRATHATLTILLSLFTALGACGDEPPVDPPPIDPPPPSGHPLADKLIVSELSATGGTRDDWLELASIADEPIDISGLTVEVTPLSASDPTVVVIGAGQSLAPGEFLVIDADYVGAAPQPGQCVRPFSLPDRTFEGRLIADDGITVDQFVLDVDTLETLRPGSSLGRVIDDMDAVTDDFISQSRATPGAPNAGTALDDPCLAGPADGEFDDHTAPCISDLDSFFWLAGSRAGTTIVKFDIIGFSEPNIRDVHFLDSVFYEVHDEWYYFRMLNGQPVVGEDFYQPLSGNYETIADIYAWAETQESLPYDSTFLTWSGDRLLSRRFYNLALDIQPRVIGAGVLMNVPARTTEPVREEIWGFELEYRDNITHPELMVYFDLLEERLPADITANLKWVIRSPEQEALAQQMEQLQLPYHDRIVRYTELSVPGETQVYNGGLVAGRVRIVRAGEPGIENATTTDILVLEEIPDYLPPCKALITTVPQTPLSHISLLAESRGIPNLYVGDLANDPAWDQWGRVRARVALRATVDSEGGSQTDQGSFDVVALTLDQYDTWRDLVPDNDRFVPQVDMASAPYTFDPAGASAAQMDALRPLIGGKSAGVLPLLEADGVVAPDSPYAVTVRGYHEHIQPMRAPWLDAMLAMTEFRYLSHRRFRYLVLEGIEAYDRKYTTRSGRVFRDGVLEEHPPGDWLGDIIRAGGVRAVVEATPIAPATLAALEADLANHFAALAPTQGLRFRSSSNVEDIEGFNGAGLYESNTGYLDPGAAGPDNADATVEAALLRTWSSYWRWEAYDERLHANVDHLSGNMGVLVHARFDDTHELANGVITMTRYPDESPTHDPDLFDAQYVMRVNVQFGSLSVTNPPAGQCVLPEVIELRQAVGEPVPTITRLGQSSEVDQGTDILADAELLDLFTQTVAVTDLWLDSENAPLAPANQRRTVSLDFEFRLMDAGWPDVDMGAPFERRMIVKQVRSLEPSTSDVPAEVVAMPFPGDVLARARTVTRRVCAGDRLTLTALEATTDPLARPALGYDAAPFTAGVTLDVTADIPELGWTAGEQVDITHVQMASFDHPGGGGGWYLTLDVDAAQQNTLGVVTLNWIESSGWSIIGPGGTAAGLATSCTSDTLHSTPDNYLLSLLPPE